MRLFKITFFNIKAVVNYGYCIKHNDTQERIKINNPETPFIIKESDINYFMNYGDGIKEMVFIGRLNESPQY